MGSSVKTITGDIGKGIGAVVTGGTSLIPGSPTKKIGDFVGGALTLNPKMALGKGDGGGGDSSSPYSAPNVGGTVSPLEALTSSGGAPLLSDIALGADVNTTLMSYFGASGNYNEWMNSLSSQDQQAIKGLSNTLGQIQTNTNMRNQAVDNLVKDYPNIMQSKIQQYSQIASNSIDSSMQDTINRTMDKLNAAQGANGNISSGAAAAAAARAGSDIGMQKAQYTLDYGTQMASQDFSQQLSLASASQAFQQKMLGQGASQGFNAVQNALAGNRAVAGQQANLNNQASTANTNYNVQQDQSLWGTMGSLAGTVIGGAFGGPVGAMAGGKIGSTLAGMNSPVPMPPPNTAQYAPSGVRGSY